MVPAGLHFRICVASASAAAAPPLPHGRGGDRLPLAWTGSRKGVGDKAGSSPPETSPRGSPPPRRPARPGRRRVPPARRRAPTHRGATCALRALPPLDAGQSASPPTRPPLPHLRGNARLLAPSAAAAAGTSKAPPPPTLPLRVRAPEGRLEPPARAESPLRPPHRPPFPAPSHTSNQQRRRVRRAEVGRRGAEHRLQRTLLLAVPALRRTSSLGSRSAPSSRPQPARPRRRALRRAPRNTDGPPPLPPPPLIVLPLPTGLGNPPARPQPIAHLLREPAPTFSRPSAEHAQNAAALTSSRARKAGEPEPASSRGESPLI